jgi:hypothetical protein
MTSPSVPAVYNTDYSFFSASLGLYLSYHTASHWAILDSSPEGIWFDAGENVEPGTLVSTGATLNIGVEILSFEHRLYAPATGQVYWSDASDNNYQVQVFTNLNKTAGDQINVGDTIYFLFLYNGLYLAQDTSNPEYLVTADASSALPFTIGSA